MRQELTIAEGIEIQQDQLKDWEKILNNDTYIRLLQKCIAENSKPMNTGYDVFRGTDMQNYVFNLYN